MREVLCHGGFIGVRWFGRCGEGRPVMEPHSGGGDGCWTVGGGVCRACCKRKGKKKKTMEKEKKKKKEKNNNIILPRTYYWCHLQ